MEHLSSETFKVGTKVRYWMGLKEGPGRVGEISYDGIYECGGTPVVYIRGRGAVALTHIENVPVDGGQGLERASAEATGL